MKLFLFIQDEPFHLAQALPPLLDRFPIVGVALMNQKLAKDSWPVVIRRYLCLLGPLNFVRMSLTVLLHKLTGKGSLSRLFRSRGIPVRFVRDLNGPDVHEWVKASAPDILVSIASPQIFRDPLISLAPYGAINLHGGVLPDFPGVLTPFWNLYNGAREAGCTLHYMSSKVDGGDIIGNARFGIDPAKDSVQSIYAQIAQRGISVLMEGLTAIAEKRAQRTPNPIRQENYHTFPTWQEGQAFRSRGLKFF